MTLTLSGLVVVVGETVGELVQAARATARTAIVPVASLRIMLVLRREGLPGTPFDGSRIVN
jgi:hypothetical protein